MPNLLFELLLNIRQQVAEPASNLRYYITLFISIPVLCETNMFHGIFLDIPIAEHGNYLGIFHRILLVPHNIVMDMNNVMLTNVTLSHLLHG